MIREIAYIVTNHNFVTHIKSINKRIVTVTTYIKVIL